MKRILFTGETWSFILTTAAFFTGLHLITVIDKFVPYYENPHEMHRIEEMAIILILFL